MIEIVKRLWGMGLDVSVEGDKVVLRGRRKQLSPELINEIKRQKPEIIKALQQPHIDSRGILVIPLGCDDKYKWWAGGQSIQETLREIGAPPEVVAKYTNSGTA